MNETRCYSKYDDDGCPLPDVCVTNDEFNAPEQCADGEILCLGGVDEKVYSKSIINLSIKNIII